ncbi:GFA family protein [Faunimonas sp. B44]|uniref:GFA family protein n=1 Tax=Faunimonas sp. B44 TaxID=3461493 RepID=UPI004043D9EE
MDRALMDPALTGGCQCGAVRYTLLAQHRTADVCHCRMCQRSSGAPFVAFAQFRAEDVRWDRGAPKLFRSSNLVDRGFCAACGTTLTYQFLPHGTVSITLASLDDPNAITPQAQMGMESRLAWLDAALALPGQTTEASFGDDLAQMVSNQFDPGRS